MAVGTSLRQVTKNRQFALWCGGQSVSQFGDGIIAVALPLLVLEITKNATDLGFVVAARLLPTVAFLLLGGAVTDRVSRRLAMMVSDASRALITATLGALALYGVLNLTELLVGSVAFGTFDALFYPASVALVPELVAVDDLTAANSVSRFSGTLAGNLVGPVVGGVVASTIGTGWSLVIDAGSFVVSAGCLAAMRPTAPPPPTGHSMRRDVRHGLAYCRRTSWILWSIVVAGLANALFFSPSAILLPLLFKRVLHTSNWMVGVGFAASGVGGLAGSLVMMTRPRVRRRVRLMWLGWLVALLVGVPYGLAPRAWIAATLAVVVGALLMVGNIQWQALMQSEVPSEMLGRVSSVDWVVSLGLTPVGVALAGVVSGAVGVRATIVVPGAVVGVLGLVLLASMRSITAIDRRDVQSEGPEA